MPRTVPFLLLFAIPALAQTASVSGFSDTGAFQLYINEESFARLTFDAKTDGSYRGRLVVSMAGQTAAFSTVVTPGPDGRWAEASVEGSDGPMVWHRSGTDIRFDGHGMNGKGSVPEDMLIFEPYSPPLLTLALLRYDKAAGGKQTLLSMALDAHMVTDSEVTVERQETFTRTINGKTLRLTRWLYAPAGREFHAVADDNGLVYYLSGIDGLPSGVSPRNVYFVREGYESLREPEHDSEPISQPQFQVELRSGVKMPMRDGVLLSTDLYLPIGARKSPVILIRTPYGKEIEVLSARFYARRGYVVAVQDVRGRGASGGKWEPDIQEPKDGYDAIEWLARQPWSTGKIGMIGASYLGWVQWLAASLHPPHLAAMIPNVSPPEPYFNTPYDHGILDLAGNLIWADRVETNAAADLSGEKLRAIDRKDIWELFQPLPVIGLDRAFLGKSTDYWRDWCMHPPGDPYWNDALFFDKLKGMRIPVFHESGWFDADGIGTKLNYLALSRAGHATQKMTIGPWGHTDSAVRSTDTVDYGPAAVIDLQRDYLRWFDHYLKGVHNHIVDEPLVSLFVMGSNRWVRGATYPLPQTRFEKLYLGTGGRLTFQAPGAQEPADRYDYDPGHPTPPAPFDGSGPEPVTGRDGVLIYTTDPFDKAYTVAGPLSAVLYAATSARDTDWFINMADIDADGRAAGLWALSGGRIRARYRHSMSKPELLEPGAIVRYDIDLWHTGVTIAPGHRLRVEIESAAFPRFDRNLNTGGNNETESSFVTAHQTVYHDSAHASYILLPRIPEN